MKKIILLFYLFVFVFYIEAQNSYQIKLKITNPPTQTAKLYRFYGIRPIFVDSTKIDEQATFNFLLSEDSPVGFYRLKISEKDVIDFIFNKNTVEMKTEYPQIYKNLEFQNSFENTVYYSHLQTQSRFDAQANRLRNNNLDIFASENTGPHALAMRKMVLGIYQQKQKNSKQIIGAYSNTYASKIIQAQMEVYSPDFDTLFLQGEEKEHEFDYLRTHYFDNVDFSYGNLVNSPVLPLKYNQYINQYMPNASQDSLKSIVTNIMNKVTVNDTINDFTFNYFLNNFTRREMHTTMMWFLDNFTLSTACQTETEKISIDEKLEIISRLAIGNQLPPLEMPTTDGTIINVHDVDADAVLLIFWKSDCAHCHELMPKLVPLYEKYRKKKLEIIAVSVDDNKDEWTKTLEHFNFPWINISDLKGLQSPYLKNFNIIFTPKIYLLDKERKIIAKPFTIIEIEEALKEL